MGPLRRIRSHDDPEVPAHEPKRDVADAPGIPRETRLGRRVEEETCFITDQTVRQALQPSQLNGGNLVDIFQNREDDFEAVETMEVSYTSSSGEKVQELVFAENSKQKTFSGPRILVSASRVNTMHRAISVLSRKVDNLTTTLRVCREHYYKELFSLRHGRQPSEEHEKFWFTPQAYQDTVSIQELRKRFGTEQEDLRKREQEVRELRAKLRQIDSIAEDRLEKLITCKTIPELFNWMRDMNGFREADFDLHLQVLAQEISLKATDANKAPDLEKEKLKSSLEDAEFEVESLQKKLMEAQVANQGLMDLLTERRAEPIVVAPAPIEEEPDLDDDSNPSSVATPVRSKEVAEMSQRRHSQATEDTLTILNRQAQAAAELAEAEEKNRQLQALVFNAIAAKRREAQWNPRLQQLNISGFSDPGVRSVHEEFSMPSVMGLKLSPREMFEFQAAERNSSRYLLTFSSDTDSPIPSFNNSAVKATQCVAAYEVVPDGSAGSRIRMVQHLNANVGMAEHVQFLWEKRVISMLSAWASELSEEARNIVAQRNCGKGGGCPLPGYDSDLLELLSPSPLQRNSSMTIAKVLSLAPKQVSFRRLTTATDSLPHWQRAFGKLPLTTVLNVTQWDSFESRADEVMSLFRLVEHNATDDEKEAFASLAHDALDVQRQGEALASLQWRYLEVINRHDCDASLPDINGNTGNRAWSFAVVVAIAVAIVVLLLSCISCCCVKLYRIRRERQARQAASLLLSAASSCAPSDRAVAPTSEASTTASQGEVLRR